MLPKKVERKYLNIPVDETAYMIPGWTHNIINLSKSENLVTIMTGNENFNKDRPNTLFEIVK